MRRLRTSYVDDWEDIGATDNPRFHVFGLSVRPTHAVALMAGATVALLAILLANSLGWFTEAPGLRRTIMIVCTVGLLTILGLSVAALLVMTRYLRRSRIHLALLDGATREEALAETDRFIRRNVYARLAIYAGACAAVWLVLGSRLLFEWTSLWTYGAGMLAMVALFVAHSAFHHRIEGRLRRVVDHFR